MLDVDDAPCNIASSFLISSLRFCVQVSKWLTRLKQITTRHDESRKAAADELQTLETVKEDVARLKEVVAEQKELLAHIRERTSRISHSLS